MSDKQGDISLDLLGIKPIADATNAVVNKSLNGIECFLKIVCEPALEEFGLLLNDKVRFWRLKNIMSILEKAQGKLCFKNDRLEIKANPRIALAIMENGSLIDNDEVQEMWAGIFTSSCTKDGQDDENLIFVDLLKQMTVCEARILKYSCETARKIIFENGLIVGDGLSIECNKLIKLSGVNEIQRLDRELNHMHSINLIEGFFGGGFDNLDNSLEANITPTSLALNLYAKTQGYNGDLKIFWQSNLITYQEKEKEKQEQKK